MAKNANVAASAVQRQSATEGEQTVSLGDVVAHRQEQEHNPESAGFERYLMVDHLDADRLKIARWGLIADGDLPPTFYKVFRAGQVLYPTRNPHLRRTAYAEFDGICGEKTLTLESNGEIEPRLLPFIFQTERFIEHAKSMAIGSTNPHVRWRDIAAYEFTLPPKDEQRRIAEILWAADETLQMHLAVQEAAELLTESLAAEFLCSDWPSVPCDQLFTKGPRNGMSPNCNAEQRGYPTLAIGAVREGRVIAEGNVKYAEISESDLERFRLHRRNVLVVRGNGNRLLCGRCGVVDLLPENCFYPDLLIRLSFDAERIDPEFAALQWNTREVHSRLLQRAKSTNGIWKINGKDLLQHRLATPPLEAQKKFMKRLVPAKDAVERAVDSVRCVEKLKHRLVNELLRGPDHVH